MTNTLVGDVYQRIIDEVIAASANDFEESGVPGSTLQETKLAWQVKLSARQVAQMPWDPKPEPVPRVQNGMPMSAQSNGVAQPSYQQYGEDSTPMAPNGQRVKLEATDQYSHPTAYAPAGPQQGGIARAQALVQERFGQQAAAALERPQGLALPGQQSKPQGLQMPGQPTPQQYAQAQHQMMQRQQAALQNQQNSPRIKVENDSPGLQQGQFQPRLANPAYAQTDGGADDLAEWQAYIAQRRAIAAGVIENNDRYMRDQITSAQLEIDGGLMLPDNIQQARAAKRKQAHLRARRQLPQPEASSSRVPQLDGADEEEDGKEVKPEEDDDDAINSDLDDPEDDQDPIGDDDDDLGDTILATYDKVQRVKNKWKSVLRDGVLLTGQKEWLFSKATGEFEW